MTRVYWLSAAAGAAALGMFSATAGAAPLANTTSGVANAAGQNSLTEQVRYGRHCWRHRGHLHCRGYRTYGYYDPYYYGGYGPYYGGYGYGPGIGLYFGGGGRHGHHHHGGGHRHR